jgi:tetratricopeptide (TPR) repeat protein
MAPKDLPWSDGDLVACAYQERAAHAYWRYLDDKKGSAGDKDQETALAICEKSYGPDNVATVYKVVLLSLIYRAMGQNDKAHLMMQRALTAVDTKPDAKGAAWYVYDYNAQLLALEHNYSAAIKSYLQAKGFCGGDSDRDRVWADFCAALRRSQPEEDKLSEPVESWLDQGKFSDLDRLSDRLNKEQTSYPIGSTPSGNMYNTLATCSTEEEYRKRFGRLSEWLKQNPRSMAAGLCLSKCYAEYAWFARGKGWADSVTERGWKLFEARLAQAKEVLDADPGITKKSPYAYFVYSKVALGQSWDKDKYMKLVHECHTLWPKYMGIDFATTWFLTPRWGGEAGESERYIESRANEIGGTKGDVAYARIVWWSQNYLDDLFSAKSPIEWSRVASGFKQLFTEYPHSLETRIGYMELARKAGHNEEFQTALNGFEPSSGSPGTPVSASNPQPASK